MVEIFTALALITSGFIFAFIGILMGAYLMFKAKTTPGSGQGFLKDPKGDVFNVLDGIDPLPMDGEPSADEENILKRTNRFLSELGEKA